MIDSRLQINELEVIESSKFIKKSRHVPFVKQQFEWDCGLASVEMVLSSFVKDQTILKEKILQHCQTQSVWTIDLAYILHHFNVQNFVFYTTSLGVKKEYSNFSFYEKEFTEDEQRVNKLFEASHEKGIKIEERILKSQEMIDLISKGWAFIVLINSMYLSTPLLNTNSQNLKTLPYQGHFLVVFDYNPVLNLFYYRDPAKTDDSFSITPEALDIARSAKGTDDDILAIHLY